MSRRAGFCLSALCASVALLLAAGPASAMTIEPPEYSESIDGTGSVGSHSPNFSEKFKMAVKLGIDQASQTLYVGTQLGFSTSQGILYKYDTTTNQPAPFSLPSLSGDTAIEQAMNSTGDLSVDNSGTATQGRFYAYEEQGTMTERLPSGESVPFVTPGGDNCGSAVDPEGYYWINQYETSISQYTPAGVPTGKLIHVTPAGREGCDFEIDSQGNFYVTTNWQNPGGYIEKYDPAGNFLFKIGTGHALTLAIDPSNDDVYVDEMSKIERYTSEGTLLGVFGEAEGSFTGIVQSQGIAVDEHTHDVYVSNGGKVAIFEPGPPIIAPDVTTTTAVPSPTGATLRGTINPDGVDITECRFEWGFGAGGSFPNTVPCDQGNAYSGSTDTPVTGVIPVGTLTKGSVYHYRVAAKNVNGVEIVGADKPFTAQDKPRIVDLFVDSVHTDAARLNAEIDPEEGHTSFHFEYGETPAYGTTVPVPDVFLASTTANGTGGISIHGLKPNTLYYYKVVATDPAGTTIEERTFSTFAAKATPPPCNNDLSRQQTGAALLPDCRSYELTSAGDTGGYSVESDLVPGQTPFAGYPQADGRVLYGVHDGGIPGPGNPTNRGVDPYIATRTESGWTTRYVGIPANGGFSTAPFSSSVSEADAALDTVAFGGPEICSPCFADGSTGIPVHMPDGSLIQGMQGTESQLSADSTGFIWKRLSADGSHLVFGSTSPFESSGNDGEVSIYDRNLNTKTTQVVSTTPLGATMTGEVGELDISSSGDRIVVGEEISTDSAENHYWHLFMHLGNSPDTVDLMPTASEGALFAGMTSDGSKVFFTTKDPLLPADDTDSSADLYEAEVGPGGALTLVLLSTGAPPPVGNSNSCDPVANLDGNNWNAVGAASANDCGVVAIGGGGGVASSDGTVYFLSPELLDGSGTLNQPNLFAVRPGQAPQFVATLEPDNNAVRYGAKDSDVRRYGDFQVTPGGHFAVFGTVERLTQYNNGGHTEVFRYDAEGPGLVCASCAPTSARPAGDSVLAGRGLSITEDGRVFFTASDPLDLRDTNGKRDPYEWVQGKPQVLSPGTSPLDSGLLSISADGTDAYFFTRDSLAPEDHNGTLMKIYDAREGGGFFFVPPPPPCAASDECHGPGTQAAALPSIGSVAGTEGNVPRKPANGCKKGFVKKHGKCVKKRRTHRRHG